MNDAEALRIWRQAAIPVVFDDRARGRLLVKVPYAEGNRAWLRGDHRHHPEWQKDLRCWQVPRAWLEDMIQITGFRYGRVYHTQPYRKQEKCAPACWDAQGFECQCSCLGANHGGGATGQWYIISDTCAIQWGARQYACRLLTQKGLPNDRPDMRRETLPAVW